MNSIVIQIQRLLLAPCFSIAVTHVLSDSMYTPNGDRQRVIVEIKSVIKVLNEPYSFLAVIREDVKIHNC